MQLKRFLEVCYQHSSKLSAIQRQEIAAYLVPEVGICTNSFNALKNSLYKYYIFIKITHNH